MMMIINSIQRYERTLASNSKQRSTNLPEEADLERFISNAYAFLAIAECFSRTNDVVGVLVYFFFAMYDGRVCGFDTPKSAKNRRGHFLELCSSVLAFTYVSRYP